MSDLESYVELLEDENQALRDIIFSMNQEIHDLENRDIEHQDELKRLDELHEKVAEQEKEIEEKEESLEELTKHNDYLIKTIKDRLSDKQIEELSRYTYTHDVTLEYLIDNYLYTEQEND